MNKKETIETQLDCKATASLNAEIEKDLEKKDSSLAKLLEDKEKTDEKFNSD